MCWVAKLITRRELVTYSKIIDLSDELAEKLLNDPDSHEVELDRICRPTRTKWRKYAKSLVCVCVCVHVCASELILTLA